MKLKHVIIRSTGCRTCRARKVKCDEARHICQRCIRSRFECQGYVEPTKFLSDNPQNRDHSSMALSTPVVRGFKAHSLTPVRQALSYPAKLTYITFLVRRLCIGIPGESRGFSWLRLGLEASDQNSLVYMSSRCLAEVYYGRVFRQEGVVTNGMAKYGSILRNLCQQLQDPEFFHINNLMSVIMTTCLIEAVADQTAAGRASGLLAHIRGLAQVIQRAGPEAFMRRPNIAIFELCRPFIVGRAIMGKHKTFIAKPEWKTIPWTYESKSTACELWDIVWVSLIFACQIAQLTSRKAVISQV